jgi:4-hydroxy-3-methylbut-2-en-1-yl diphosphate reductase
MAAVIRPQSPRVGGQPALTVYLAQPRGFCAGVARAIDIVERALTTFGAPVYVFHEIVHNGHVVDDLATRGAVFVDTIAAIPEGAVTVFSAHGVSNAVVAEAKSRRLRVIDATCPLVTKVHLQAQRYARAGHAVVLIGHIGHEEVEGTVGSVDAPVHVIESVEDVARLPLSTDTEIAYVTQTTLSIDDTRDVIAALTARFPRVRGPGVDDICYATSNRQEAVRSIAKHVDVVLVVGARNSSNSNRLREVAAQTGASAYLITGENEIEAHWLQGRTRIAVTAGASTPEALVRGVCRRLKELGAASIEQLPGVIENVAFKLPSFPGARVPLASV